MKRSIFMEDTAVSESLGYILIAGILLLSFAIIFVIGYPIYNGYIDGGHMKNMEDSFSIVAYNGNNVAMLNSPTASSELKMYGGNLATRGEGLITVTCYEWDGTNFNQKGDPYSLTFNIIEYSKGTDKIAYIGGSVCRLGQTGSVMLREPEIYEDETDKTVVMSIVNLYDSEISIAGDGPMRIAFTTPYYSKMAQTVISPTSTKVEQVDRIEINIKSDYGNSFRGFFQDRLGYDLDSVDADGTINLHKDYSDATLYYMQCKVTVEAK